jgi:hypothetical protein
MLALGVFVGCTSAPKAFADERADCASSAEKAQEARDEGKYRKARESMLLCSREVCPATIRTDCVRWLSELEGMAPSVVVNAREGAQDLTAVKVTMDGTVLADKLDGKPIFVDPGEHVFIFEKAGLPPKGEKVLIRTGEKNRVLNVQFEGPKAAPAAPGPANAQAPAGTDAGTRQERPAPVLSYALGGVGVVGLASFAFFGLTGQGDVSDMESGCKPNCAQDRVDSAKTKLLVADISLGVGVLALGAAAYFYFAQPKVEARSTSALPRWNVDLKPALGGGTATLGGRF